MAKLETFEEDRWARDSTLRFYLQLGGIQTIDKKTKCFKEDSCWYSNLYGDMLGSVLISIQGVCGLQNDAGNLTYIPHISRSMYNPFN